VERGDKGREVSGKDRVNQEVLLWHKLLDYEMRKIALGYKTEARI